MRHVIVTRFSVPRLDAATADRHRDPEWLAERLTLFRRFFVPSVGRLAVPAVLLCSSESAETVAAATADLPWVRIAVQDEWHGGWRGEADEMLTRLDSDDALHDGWFRAVGAAPAGFEACCTHRFLRLDVERGALYERRRTEPAPLAAFRPGVNPYAWDHAVLERRLRVHALPDAYLLQAVHGGNLSSRRPRWWHFRYRVPLARLQPFGVTL